MAIEHGTCGSLKSLRKLVANDLQDCPSPSHVEHTAQEMARNRPNWLTEVTAEVAQYVENLNQCLPALEAQIKTIWDSIRDRIAPELSRIADSIERLSTPRFFLLKWFNQWFRIPHLRRRAAWLQQAPRRAAQSSVNELDNTKRELNRIYSAPDAEISSRMTQREALLKRLQAIIASPVFAGAVAECAMAKTLVHGLPDDFHVFHDVQIDQDHWSFDGQEHRKSAQIDHVVVGFGGVFVIETKLWSAQFASQGQYYDPYRQVRWAGRLLHRCLSDRCARKIRVREVIATRGALPSKPDGSYARTIPPDQVCGYVKYFKPEIDVTSLSRIIDLLCNRC